MEKIKKTRNIDLYVFLIIVLIIVTITSFIEIDSYDELWNFSNVYKMTNGYTIYNDLNVIITPLFFYIGEILFKILGASFLTFRIYSCLINVFFWFMIYKIFTELKITKIMSLLYTIILLIITKTISSAGANYNILTVAFYLLGMLINLKIDRNKKYLPYLQGIITFVIFLTKQNIGIYYLIASFIMHIIFAIKNKELKQEIIKFLKELITFIVLIVVFLGILYLQNNLYSFIDYCFLGIKEFANENIFIHPTSVCIALIILINIAFSIFLLKTGKVSEDIKNSNIKILPFVLMITFVMYPLANEFHGYLALVVAVIPLVSNISKIIIEEILDKNKLEKVSKIINCIIIGIFLILFIIGSYSYCKSLNTYIDPYFGSKIKEEDIDYINKICDFINENNKNGIDVKIISHKSDLYINVLKQNNGKMDLPFKGNLGSKGEDGLIEEISLLKNIKILIQKDEETFWQESEKVRNYIKDNLKPEGEIEDFLIYSK